jgi:DNA-binding transcriptional regulator YiaG
MPSREFKRIRSKLKLTQQEAARILGLSSSTVVSNIETGFRKPTKLTLSVLKILESLPESDARELANQLEKLNGRQS